MDFVSVLRLIIYVAYVLVIIGTMLIVISENRNPIRTLAWILILNFIPVFGLILYYVLGQDTQRKKYFKKRGAKHTYSIPKSESLCRNKDKVPDSCHDLVKLLEPSECSDVLYGSDVEIMTTGERKFAALIDDLKNAKHHIHMEYFLFNKDETGKEIKQILMAKAAEGVEVRFIYENVANITVRPKFYYEMEKSGVMVCPFMKMSLPRIRRTINYRNHRKVVVIDGKIGYIGGMNIGDEYAKDPNWRDTHLRIKGQGVLGLQAHFLNDWSSSGEKTVENKREYFPEQKIYSNNLMQIASGGPDSPYSNLLHAAIRIIVESQQYIYIQTPYFLPTDALFHALYAAAAAGVDVRLMVSAKSDTAYIDPAMHSYYEDLLEAGMRIYEHQTKFIHAKTMVSDDYVSVIGSTNMDFRSFEASFEINCYMYDADIALQNKAIFFEDLKGCKEIVLEEWVKRPGWKKLLESFLRLFAPLM
ncbi:cardiolipin synthase [Paludibacter sp. 221]|uniref:cardiolipin synthase n=1 Tax=Paludibacter sp. 221 TaxID=2302939 RepID=UPI0013D65590|nr:cardiolipin synthase [Paludibacter sp. 221]NDV47927.1 cardiolipin synthase [Paludibacter sp. 221]